MNETVNLKRKKGCNVHNQLQYNIKNTSKILQSMNRICVFLM